jgi:dihydrofolate reductase
MVTLDGFFEGPNREIDWHNVDKEFNEFAAQQLDSLEVLLFGRVTYEMMASYWPTETAITSDPIIAEKMNSKAKIVFSTTLEKADWNNTQLIKENIIKETSRLKQKTGRDMAIFGSANLANSLLEAGLIDEIRMMVNPIILRDGHPMFENGQEKLHLKLVNSRTFGNGNVLLIYQPVIKIKGFWQRILQTFRSISKQTSETRQ